jgi:hypothetical protein
LCAAIAHNLLHAAGVLAGDQHTRARGSTLRRRIITVPARLARPSADRSCTCPPTGPGRNIGLHYGTTRLDVRRPSLRHPDHPPTGPTAANRKSWADQQIPHAHNPKNSINKLRHHSTQPIGRVARGNRTPGLPQIPA